MPLDIFGFGASYMSSCHLLAEQGSDYWRKPPDIDIAQAPSRLATISSSTFRSARVTVSGAWTRQYDQGGLLILLPSFASDSTRRCWIKAGIEFCSGKPYLSVVAAREWADWSLIPITKNTATIEFEREEIDPVAKKGSSLFVYLAENGKRSDLPIREITWAFQRDGEMEIGVYAARPTKIEGDHDLLKVHFEEYSVETIPEKGA